MTTKYPMLVMKIETFLGMKTLQSHQEMLVAKTLLPFNRSTMTGRVIFVSHQVRMVDRSRSGDGPRGGTHVAGQRREPPGAPGAVVPMFALYVQIFYL